MKKYFNGFFLFLFIIFIPFIYKNYGATPQKGLNIQNDSNAPIVVKFDAETAKIDSETVEIIQDDRLSGNKGMALKPGVLAAIDGERADADLSFDIKVPAGRYIMTTHAVTYGEGTKILDKATSKYEGLPVRIQIGNQRPSKYIVIRPPGNSVPLAGIFEFEKEEKIKIWLHRFVLLKSITLSTYVPPAVPEKVKNYHPKILPPASHPRLWITSQSLPKVKERLESGENLAVWWEVKKSALTPYIFELDAGKGIMFEEELEKVAELEKAAEQKAFYYLMTGDKKIGREAITLMSEYLQVVKFGNINGIWRQIGRTIYASSIVYDWCYDLLSWKEKQIFCDKMLRLADDMETGWPPFKQPIVIGHGSEDQVCRNLLSMSIAIYDEDPLPYQYCSYKILEELVPMRSWQYQSPRHNQGVNYGGFRTIWDMHAAWLFYRMAGRPVFDENIKNLPLFWFYMRLPDGQMLRDGDGIQAGQPGEFFYWRSPLTMFLLYTYAKDPLVKAEFQRQGGVNAEFQRKGEIPKDLVLFLLLNDPELKAEPSLESFPLTIDFGPILGSMVTRTGWHIGMNSNDVVAEIKGGGYLFGNHQHSDAGSIQVYYRGFQLGDIGVYGFYGTPYDNNFHKRSISHSMMLARDTGEKFGNIESNDGGTKFNRRHPITPEEAQTDPWFNNGKEVSADFGPSKLRPFFSYFAVDLTDAYSSKIEAYKRGFCFLNLDRDSIPAAIILTDDMTTANPEFKKYWQINTHNPPQKTGNGIILNNRRKGLIGKAHVDMLIPEPGDREMEILSGLDANSSFEFRYEIPGRAIPTNFPEVDGHRIMISPKTENKRDQFLTVFQLTAGDTKPLPTEKYETPVSYVVIIDDRVVSMSIGTGLIDRNFILKIPAGGEYQVLLAGMKQGNWSVQSKDDRMKFNTYVEEGKNTIFFLASSGEYLVTPGRIDGARELLTDESFMPRYKD